MEIHVLSEQERTAGFTHRIRITLADITALGAGTTGTIDANAPGVDGHFMERVAAVSRTAIAGGSVSALTVSLGDSGSATRFGAAFDIFNKAAGTWIAPTDTKTLLAGTFILKLAFTSTSANLNALTAGEIDILIRLVDQNLYTK
jgi:hypothetical protein